MNLITARTQKICFVFPGQLLELPENTNDILLDKAVTEPLALRARELTGFVWEKFSFCNPELNNHINLRLQVTNYLISIMYFNCLVQSGLTPDIISEHSMGIYAALVAAGVFTFEEGLELVFKIGLLIEAKAVHLKGAMASIIGLTEREINSIFKQLDKSRLFIANYNGSRQFVLSGHKDGIEQAIVIALHEYHAVAARRLILTAPMHCSLLEGLQNELMSLLSSFSPRDPLIPVVNHLTADICISGEVVRLLCEEVYKPVFWEQCVYKIKELGATLFVEVGYGETLNKLTRWIDKDITVVNIKNKRSLEKIRNTLLCR